MFKLDTEAALLATFRPKDRAVVELPAALQFPLVVRDYLAWTHPSGGRVYLVFAVPGGAPTGIAFESNGGHGTGVPHMCDWCHCAGVGTEVGLLSAVRNAKHQVGVNVCTDLSCNVKLEDAANRGGYSARGQLEKLVERMGRFARDGLQIDLSGAGRGP